MPYTHYHDFSIHTHHQRPKGGRHYRAVRSRQRPWRIVLTIALLIAGAWLAWNLVGDKGVELASSATDSLFPTAEEREARRLDKEAEQESRRLEEEAEREARQRDEAAKEEARQTQHEQTIIELINEERRLVDAGDLTWDPHLQRIARAHSKDMAEKDYFSHVNKTGQDYRQRALSQGYVCRNPKWRGVAENIYFGSRGFRDPGDAVRSWKGSPGHRRAMLDRTFSKAAVGVHEGHSTGYGKGYFTTLLLC